MNSNFSSNVLAEKQCIMLCWGASSDGGCTGIAWRKKPCYYYLSNGGDPRRRSKSGCFMVVCFARKKKNLLKNIISYLIVYFNLLAAL